MPASFTSAALIFLRLFSIYCVFFLQMTSATFKEQSSAVIIDISYDGSLLCQRILRLGLVVSYLILSCCYFRFRFGDQLFCILLPLAIIFILHHFNIIFYILTHMDFHIILLNLQCLFFDYLWLCCFGHLYGSKPRSTHCDVHS